MPLKIIHESDTLLVMEKPAGMPVLPEGQIREKTVQEALGEQFPALLSLARAGILHRLDKDTSGILLVAKTKEAFEFFQKKFAQRAIEKTYICLVEGTIKEDAGRIETLVGRSKADPRKQKTYAKGEPGSEGKREALTEYLVQARYKGYTLLEVHPHTGRKHQIRVHLAHLGHPIAGDKLYAFKNQKVPKGLRRQFLHAAKIRVPMPDGTHQEFSSPLPEDLQEILRNLQPYDD